MFDLATSLVISMVLVLSKAQTNDNCYPQWQAYGQCMRKEWSSQPDELIGLTRPSGSVMKNLHISQTRGCLQRFGCSDPLSPSDGLTRARTACFPRLLQTLKSELETCVKKDVQRISLPEDDYSGEGNATNVLLLIADDALRHPEQYCPIATIRDSLLTCVRSKLPPSNITTTTQPHFTHESTASPYCAARRLCKSRSSIVQECEDLWQNRVKQKLCTCADDIRSQFLGDRFARIYETCARGTSSGGRTLSNDLNSDVIFDWLDDYLKASCSGSPAMIPGILWNQPTAACDGTQTTGFSRTTDRPSTTQGLITWAPFLPESTTSSSDTLSPSEPSSPWTSPDTTLSPLIPSFESTPGLLITGSDTLSPEVPPSDTPAPSGPLDGSDSTTHTYFFQQFTDSAESGKPDSSSTPLSSTRGVSLLTTESNVLGINNILGIKAFGQGGLLGNLLNFTQVSSGLGNLFHGSKGQQ